MRHTLENPSAAIAPALKSNPIIELSLENITKAIETGAAPETLVKRMVELEKEKKTLEGELKREEKGIVYLDKDQVVFWLEQFKDGNIEDEDFRRQLIDLFVNSVTVWDEPDDIFKITIAYNLTSLQEKTYRLPKDGTLSDFASNTPRMNSSISCRSRALLRRCAGCLRRASPL